MLLGFFVGFFLTSAELLGRDGRIFHSGELGPSGLSDKDASVQRLKWKFMQIWSLDAPSNVLGSFAC